MNNKSTQPAWKKANPAHQQLKIINARMEKLVDQMNCDYNNCVQELLQLSTLLSNLEMGHFDSVYLDTNEALLEKV